MEPSKMTFTEKYKKNFHLLNYLKKFLCMLFICLFMQKGGF